MISQPLKKDKDKKFRRFFFHVTRFFVHRFTSYSLKGYGIHSPFVFNLLTNVINDHEVDNSLKDVSVWHKSLYKNTRSIDSGEFGAGSVTGNSGHRKIKNIAMNSSVKPKYGKLLFRLVRHFSFSSALELGTGLGISTAYIWNAVPDINLTSVEGATEKILFAKKEFISKSWGPVGFVQMEFDDFIQNFEIVSHPFLAFIDGNHHYQATMNYFNKIASQCQSDSLLIFDDIHWSREMERAWNEICIDDRVSLSIDLFSMGLIFFRKGFEKSHYKINFF